MAIHNMVHHVGTFLLFAASILLLITTITAPVINDLPILRVHLTNSSNGVNSSVNFGTFGYCVLDVAATEAGKDYCTGKVIGYNPALVMSEIDGTDFNTAATDTSKALTRVMILHPVACGLSFVAFFLALGSGICGAVFASFVSAIAFVVTIVVMATDFVLFGIIKNHVNDDNSGSHAYFSVGMWTVLAAMVILFFATFIILFSCFAGRRAKRNARMSKSEYGNGTTTTKRRFWQRRSNY